MILNSGMMFTFHAAHTYAFRLLMMLRGQGPVLTPSTCRGEDGSWQAFPSLYSLLDVMENMQVSLHVVLAEKPLSLTSASCLLSEMFDCWAPCWTLTTSPQMQERGSLFQLSESESNDIQIVKGWKWGGLRKEKGKDTSWEHLVKHLEFSS